jgi:apolipoprotein D and lipocalin family protein
MKHIITLLTILLLASPAIAQDKELRTVPYVNLDRYAGRWYEIAAFPQRFQRGCSCTMTEYAKNSDGTISVTNICNKNGQPDTARAKAFVVNKDTRSKLAVQFQWPFRGKYWVIDLAEDYSWAVVSHPNRKYLWILSRKPTMDAAIYDGILQRATAQGLDIAKLQKTVQCDK